MRSAKGLELLLGSEYLTFLTHTHNTQDTRDASLYTKQGHLWIFVNKLSDVLHGRMIRRNRTTCAPASWVPEASESSSCSSRWQVLVTQEFPQHSSAFYCLATRLVQCTLPFQTDAPLGWPQGWQQRGRAPAFPFPYPTPGNSYTFTLSVCGWRRAWQHQIYSGIMI